MANADDLAWYELPSRLRIEDGKEIDPDLPPEDRAGREVDKVIDSLRDASEWRRQRYCHELSLFEGRQLDGYDGASYSDWTESELDYLGLVRSAVLHAVADVYGPLQPKPQYQTTGATWDLRRKAKRMDRIAEGIINSPAGRFVNVWEFMQDAAVDCGTHGISAIHVDVDDDTDEMCHENRCWLDVWFDPSEGMDPQNMFWREPVNADYAREKWGTDEDGDSNGVLLNAKKWEPLGESRGGSEIATEAAVDQYELRHAIKLPHGDNKGRHIATLGGHTVIDDDWESPSFPWVFLAWEFCRKIMDAQGIAAEGASLAKSAGELRLRREERVRTSAKTYIVAEEESIVDTADLESNEATVVYYRKGAAQPSPTTMVPFSSVEEQFEQTVIRSFWDKVGLSQVSAAARREPGVSSGIALITLNNTKQGRQLPKAQRYENAFVALGQQYYYALRRAAKRERNVKITWAGRNVLRTFAFADADLGDNPLRVSVAKASALPRDPVGRQQVVQSMVESSLLTAEQAKRLIQWPDLDSELDIENAETEYIDMLIDRYLDAEQGQWSEADWDPPEAFIADKVGALKRFAAAWYQAKIDQAMLPKEERGAAELPIKLIGNYITDLAKLIPPPPAATPATQQAPGALPVAPAPTPGPVLQ